MPNTPKFGFPYEKPPFSADSDEPGITLHGGSTGSSDILAEKVEEELERIDDEHHDLIMRVEALEDGRSGLGWIHINEGSDAGENFSIDLTNNGKFNAGEFALLRLFMRFDLNTTGYVSCRINGEFPSVYTTGSVITGADGSTIDTRYSGSFSRWHIGRGATPSTNNLKATFFHMNGTALHSYQATSQRPNTGGASGHSSGRHWGSITSALNDPPSSLYIFADSGADSIVNSWWWVEGYRIPS